MDRTTCTNRMNRLSSLLLSLAVMFLAVTMALSLCRGRTGDSDRGRALRAAPSSWSPLSPPPWNGDCATENECIA